MRIVIDLQGAQTESRFRGIGRYALNFTKALARNRGAHEIIIVLNALFPETIGPIRAAFRELLPADKVVVFDVPGPVAEIDPRNRERRETAELVREAFLASLDPDVVHITSLFEGYIDDAITSIGRLDGGGPVSATLYDLVPLLNKQEFLQENKAYSDYYFRKIGALQRAQKLLAISDAAAAEAIEQLGRNGDEVPAVGTGRDDRFHPVCLATADAERLLAEHSVTRAFFLVVGAPDARKNHQRMVEAFGLLPDAIRNDHQLVLAGDFPAEKRRAFARHAQNHGLASDALIFTGPLSDPDLVALYNLAQGVIVPSLQEGFGLPALEGMQCGRAVIASRIASLAEVIGRDDALFDPRDPAAMVRAMARLAGDDVWRGALAAHGLARAVLFDWDEVAKRAFAAFAAMGASATRPAPRPAISTQHRPRLAFVSPLPPEQTGIANYAAELLPALSAHYEIEVIVNQAAVRDPFIEANLPVRSVAWFAAHADDYDRIVYQFGNSPFHAHMFRLIDEHPGIAVLHEFLIGEAQASRFPDALPELAEVMWESHGYPALRELIERGYYPAVQRYPMNLAVLQAALGVIVHSQYARRLGEEWVGPGTVKDWAVVPHLRSSAGGIPRAQARAVLGIGADELVVCSFGVIGPLKLSHRVLDAWLASRLHADAKARLVFVGPNNDRSDYGGTLRRRIQTARAGARIGITGWTDASRFRAYLAAADIGVQLRANSRGETSGAVLDCMNASLACIVNAHGSMAELDPTGVWLLPETFRDAELVQALDALGADAKRRAELGSRARAIIRSEHAPRLCAAHYAAAIETAYASGHANLDRLIRSFRSREQLPREGERLAVALSRDFPPAPRQRQLLVDVSALAIADIKTGIQRVVRAILLEWLNNPPPGWRVEPVYATPDSAGYRYARRLTCRFLGLKETPLEECAADAWAGDVFIALDFATDIVLAHRNLLQEWCNREIKVWFFLHDLLPVTMPKYFPSFAEAAHREWLTMISHFDGVVCVSRAMAEEFRAWLAETKVETLGKPCIKWSHHGADIDHSAPTKGIPRAAEVVLGTLGKRQSFLTVGTVEPRKGYLQTIEAFDLLWGEGADVNLVIVGAEGWKDLPDRERRTIPRIVRTLQKHPERNKRLFWLNGISDEYLEAVYSTASCLIAASEGEGFGLPLIEAARHNVPILARDIPVFHEVAGEHAWYFSGLDAADLATAVRSWRARATAGSLPDPNAVHRITWAESARGLLGCIGVLPELSGQDSGCLDREEAPRDAAADAPASEARKTSLAAE